MKKELIEIEKLLDKKFLKFYKAKYLIKQSNKETDYFFVSRNNTKDLAMIRSEIKPTAIEAFTYIKEDDNYKIVMIEEFRSAMNRNFFSFTAGLIEEDEDYVEAIKREIKEEIGGITKNIELCQNYPIPICPGLTDEANIFAIVELESLGEQHLEELEDIKVRIFEIDDLERKINNNELLLTISGYLGCMLLINKIKSKIESENIK